VIFIISTAKIKPNHLLSFLKLTYLKSTIQTKQPKEQLEVFCFPFQKFKNAATEVSRTKNANSDSRQTNSI